MTPCTVLVHFTIDPTERLYLLGTIDGFIDEVVRHADGFIGSTVLVSEDGAHVYHVATWRDRDAYERFLADPATLEKGRVFRSFGGETTLVDVALVSGAGGVPPAE